MSIVLIGSHLVRYLKQICTTIWGILQCVVIYDIVVIFDFEVSLWGICFRGRVIGVPHKLF